MITRTITVCTFVVLSVLLIFCFTSIPDNAESVRGGPAPVLEKSDGETASYGADNAAIEASGEYAAVAKSRVKRQFRTLPAMNIPAGFFFLMIPIMILLLIYLLGIIVNDISREDEESVKKIFGTLN